jgi:hypothetical protein
MERLKQTEKSPSVFSWTMRLAGLAASLMSAASRATAQGCAMCYQNAASSGAQGGAALRHGILILLAPALSVFVSIFVLIYRRRSAARQELEAPRFVGVQRRKRAWQ